VLSAAKELWKKYIPKMQININIRANLNFFIPIPSSL